MVERKLPKIRVGAQQAKPHAIDPAGALLED
jgi:hypothetical protein